MLSMPVIGDDDYSKILFHQLQLKKDCFCLNATLVKKIDNGEIWDRVNKLYFNQLIISDPQEPILEKTCKLITESISKKIPTIAINRSGRALHVFLTV